MSISKAISTFVLMITAFGPLAIGDVIEVPANFTTIQEAIDAANTGDQIIVSQGTYLENINFNGQAVTLQSTNPQDPAVVAATIIDANGTGSVVTCMNGEGPDTVLSGFTITGANGSAGGGMHNVATNATVSYCVFRQNSAGRGAGIFNLNSSPTVTHCVFSENIANTFGGGIHNVGDSDPPVTDCTFVANTAVIGGGGMSNFNSNPELTNCMFSGNTTPGNGGAMYNLEANPTVTNSSFSENDAGGTGGAINNIDSNPVITNSILWGNGPGSVFNDTSVTTIAYSDVAGSGGSDAWNGSFGTDGGGNIDVDPMFVDADGIDNTVGTEDDNLRLAPGSPCIDQASNAATGLSGILTDLDGNSRFLEDPDSEDCVQAPGTCGVLPVVDMGPYEFVFIPPLTPAASQWGLITMVLLLAIAGTVVLRRTVPASALGK